MGVKCTDRRDVEVPDCRESNEKDCGRSFDLYLPSAICGGDGGGGLRGLRSSADAPAENNNGGEDDDGDESSPEETPESVGTLPLVFGIHCFGCTAKAIDAFVEHADSRNMVLVLPHGIQNSFNAKDCCGYAKENEVDDVGFFKHVQAVLSEEYEFVDADYSYAVGWSNGGFMVMHAASLFRAISPISGYIADIDPALTKGGTFCVDGICVDSPGNGKGIFMHHGVDDTFVRPTGCCDDPDLPKCCCNIVADTCVPVMGVAQNWALEVNKCEVHDENDEPETADGGEEGGEDGKGSRREMKDGEDDDSSSASGAKFVVSYTDPDEGIECVTSSGTDCKSNTTICMHAASGHFNQPSFGEKFPFAREVIDFFARDACEVNDGEWDESGGSCSCPESHGGKFCLDDPVVEEEKVLTIHAAEDVYDLDSGGASSSGSPKRGVVYVLVAMAVFYVIRRYKTKKSKMDDAHSGDARGSEIEEMTELVSSRGLHTN